MLVAVEAYLVTVVRDELKEAEVVGGLRVEREVALPGGLRAEVHDEAPCKPRQVADVFRDALALHQQ